MLDQDVIELLEANPDAPDDEYTLVVRDRENGECSTIYDQTDFGTLDVIGLVSELRACLPEIRLDRDLSYDAGVTKYRPMLRALSPNNLRGVLGNVVAAALAHPGEQTARALLYQIEAHYQCQQEEAAREALPV